MDSKLQIISGRFRGKKLFLPINARPTQNRARIALFNMLTQLVDTVNHFVVWDAFAGSGAFGLEFLSRFDNAFVIFTDISADAFKVINKNAAGILNAKIEMVDALNAAKRHGTMADIIFIDPPYAEYDLARALIRKLTNLVKPGAIIVWEAEASETMQFSDKDWILLRDRTYGRARFLILKKA